MKMIPKRVLALLLLIALALSTAAFGGCSGNDDGSQPTTAVSTTTANHTDYTYDVYSLNRNGVELSAITVPTPVICGSSDPYLNYDIVNTSLASLPEGSALDVIEGGAHVIMYEYPYYHEFQSKLIAFLKG